jgi:hypothetical protein
MKLVLEISRLVDQFITANFENILDAWNKDPYLKGEFVLIEGKITGNQTSQKFRHNLKFIPKDAIVTSAIWSGTIGVMTVKNDEFDSQNIAIKTTGLSSTETVTFRALIGRMA